jgi:hypothetical protein
MRDGPGLLLFTAEALDVGDAATVTMELIDFT